MGWAHGINSEGREIGYGVAATCDHPKCEKEIHRGLAYCCGELDGVDGEHGCGLYFCGEHEMRHACESYCDVAFCWGSRWHEIDLDEARA